MGKIKKGNLFFDFPTKKRSMKRISLIFLVIATFAFIAVAGISPYERNGSCDGVKALAARENLTVENAKNSVTLTSDNDLYSDNVLTPSEIGEFVREMTEADLNAGIGNDAYGFIPDPDGMFYNFEAFVTGGDSPWDCMMYSEEFTATSTLAPQGNIRYDARNLRNCESSKMNMRNGGDRTATWSKGTPGRGVGERVNMHVTTQGRTPGNIVSFHSIMIVNGYARNETTWRNNSRVKILRLYVGDKHWCDLHLSDVIKPQIFHLPEHLKIVPHKSGKKVERPLEWRKWSDEKTAYKTELSFEIKEVYPGERFEDTCITGIALDAVSDCY